MSRLQLISMALVVSFTVACATDELTGEPTASDEDADEDVPEEPEGTPPVEGEPVPAPFGGIEGNYTGGDVSAPDAEPLDAEAMSKVTAAEALFPTDECALDSKIPVRRILPLNHRQQAKYFYCGPATGYMIINYLHGSDFRSRKNNARLNQSNLATQAHMETEARESTPWAAKVFTKGLNAWRGNRHYAQVARPSARQFRGALGYSIGSRGMPFAANTVEFAGGVHYNGHPVNRTIGHWIVVHGYDECGAKAHFADPATSVWSAVNPKFSYRTKPFADRFLQNNGIVY